MWPPTAGLQEAPGWAPRVAWMCVPERVGWESFIPRDLKKELGLRPEQGGGTSDSLRESPSSESHKGNWNWFEDKEVVPAFSPPTDSLTSQQLHQSVCTGGDREGEAQSLASQTVADGRSWPCGGHWAGAAAAVSLQGCEPGPDGRSQGGRRHYPAAQHLRGACIRHPSLYPVTFLTLTTTAGGQSIVTASLMTPAPPRSKERLLKVTSADSEPGPGKADCETTPSDHTSWWFHGIWKDAPGRGAGASAPHPHREEMLGVHMPAWAMNFVIYSASSQEGKNSFIMS